MTPFSTRSYSRCRLPGKARDPVRGRLHRHHDAKHEIRIIDYVDHSVPVLRRMFAKRQRAYTGLGYAPR